MFNAKKILKIVLASMAVVICALLIPTHTAAAATEGIYLGGFSAGFVLNTTQVEVVGLCEVLSIDGVGCPARDAGICTGDIIEKINECEVKKASDINEIISRSYKKFIITVRRGGSILTMEIQPKKEAASGTNRIGVLVKDSINGIGTVTYIDATNKKFASLGHPVTNQDNTLIEINGGTVYNGLIYDVKKGARGTPGELRGVIESGREIGTVSVNCQSGVFGDLAKDYDLSNLTKVEVGSVDDVQIGEATIYSTVYGKSVEKYKISIAKVDKHSKDNRNFVIKVEDDRLLEKTGGIVQGMSGSPIVQNGKLIGAVTHVFVNDPTRGYGIAIEHMMNSY